MVIQTCRQMSACLVAIATLSFGPKIGKVYPACMTIKVTATGCECTVLDGEDVCLDDQLSSSLRLF